ncbi:histidine kinase [Streptomyces sp. ACT015]|uniref:sensor histidine kinase n=1 Tax=Streptomyces sp. ACT015 TaxID=3134807 RepID=UPI003D185DC8
MRATARGSAARALPLPALAAACGLLPLLAVPPLHPVLAVLEALWAALLVGVRRARPAAAVLCAAPLLVGGNLWTTAVVPLLVLSATRLIAPTRRAWRVVGAACLLVVPLTGVRLLLGSGSRWEVLGGDAVSVLLVLVLPALSGTLLGRRRPLADLLRERNAYLEQTRALTAEAARLEERARIAGEMHDLLGHRLSLISVHAGALELAAARQAPPLAGQVEFLRTTAGTALEELREVLGVLRHADLADGTGVERGTLADVTALVAQSRQAGGSVELEWTVPGSAEVGVRTRQALHRVVREGLTNVLKHAPGAPARVAVRPTASGIEVAVTNGVPDGARSAGGTRSGLAGLQERIALLGGTFEAGALPDGGFRMTARLPAKVGTPDPTSPTPDTPGHTPDTPGHMPDALGPPPGTPDPASGAPDLAPGTPDPAPGAPAASFPAQRAPATGPAPSAGPRPGPGPWTGGVRPPVSEDVLTWPRVLGAGCAAVLVVLPTAGFLAVLVLTTLVK